MSKQKEGHPRTRKEIIEKIKPILKKHKVTKAGIFGSFARKEATESSDLDLVIGFEDDKEKLLITAISKIEEETGVHDDNLDLLTYLGRLERPSRSEHVWKNPLFCFSYSTK